MLEQLLYSGKLGDGCLTKQSKTSNNVRFFKRYTRFCN